jgi:WD40 repeat protein
MLGACFHDARVCDAVFSPDGRRVLTRTDGDRAFIWDYERSRLVAPPLAHAGRVRHITYSPDGRSVATASADGTACVWDAETGARRLALRHDAPLTWVEFHPDGRRIATAAEDGTVRMWSARDGSPIDWRLPVAAVVEHLAFSPDGSRILTACRDRTARVWGVASAEPVSPPLPYRPPTEVDRYRFNQHMWPRFAPDGEGVASLDGYRAHFWPGGANPEIRTVVIPFRGIEVHFFPGANRMLVTGESPRIGWIAWDDGTFVRELNHTRNANLGAVSPDGKWMLTGSSGGQVHLWDAATARRVGPPRQCGDFCSAVAFTADGSRHLASSQDGTVRVWAIRLRRPAPRPYRYDCGRANLLSRIDKRSGTGSTFSPGGRRRVEWSVGGRAVFFPGPDAPARPVCPSGPVEAARFCDDGSRFVLAGGRSIRAWDAETLAPAGPPIPAATPAGSLSWRYGRLRADQLSRDGIRVVAWDDPKTLSVWDLTTGRRVFGPARHPNPGPVVFASPNYFGHVSDATLSPDGRRLAVAIETTGTLTVWDVESGRIVHHGRLFRGFLSYMHFSSDGRRILLFSTDTLAQMLDAETGKRLAPPVRQSNESPTVGASLDGRRLVVYDVDGDSLRVLDVERGERILSLPYGDRGPAALWFDADGSSIIAMSGDALHKYPIPQFDGPFADAPALLRFLTGQEIDETDGIGYIDQFTFTKDPGRYRDAFLAWKESRGGGE